MGIRVLLTNVFAVLFLIFVNSVSAADDPYYLLKAGTRIKVKLDAPVSSRFSSANDTFVAMITEPVRNGGRIVLDEGVVIDGRVIAARPNGGFGRIGELELEFVRIRFDGGETRNISAKLARPLTADSRRAWTVASILGGTLGGALIGALTGNGRTAAIGGGIGAAAGTGAAAAIKGSDAGIKAGEEFEIVLQRDVTLPFDEV